MYTHRNRLSRLGLQPYIRSANRHAGLAVLAIGRNLLFDETMQPGSRTLRFREQRMSLGKGSNSPIYSLLESLDRVRLRKVHGGLNSRQHVLGAVLGFASENCDLRLAFDAVRNVAGEAACMDELVSLPQNVGIDKGVTG